MVRPAPKTPAAAPRLPRVIAKRYEVTQEIARGGCAVVLEARDVRLGRLVAIKMPKPGMVDDSAVERLTREARVAASVHHPNVCSVTDAGWLDEHSPYLVLERLYGETLGAYVARLGHLDADEAIEICIQTLSALHSAHVLGVVHRDVKPDNIFLVHREGCAPIVKLLDFGLCRGAESASVNDELTLTRVGTVVGTPEYMSPEQASGVRAFDARIDVWAVGVVLYEILTGTRAFVAENVSAVLSAVLSKSLPSLRRLRPELPSELEQVLAKAMDRDPRRRYRSGLEMQGALLRVRSKVSRTSSVVLRAEDEEAEAWAPEQELPTRQMASTYRR
jgi:serine/threonine protein kinase